MNTGESGPSRQYPPSSVMWRRLVETSPVDQFSVVEGAPTRHRRAHHILEVPEENRQAIALPTISMGTIIARLTNAMRPKVCGAECVLASVDKTRGTA